MTKRHIKFIVAGLLCILVALLAVRWKHATDVGGQMPADPFRIAGNLYYVGTSDVTAFLITGPEGDILIGDGRVASAPLILASIAKLGFKITDVKVLLNTHPHFDHAGSLAALQIASGAEVWISEPDAHIVANGGVGDRSLGPWTFLSYVPFFRYPAPRIDHRFKDGETIHVGPLEITGHITGGHTPGSTSWSFPVRDGDRELLAVDLCDLDPPLGVTKKDPEYPQVQADFDHTFKTLKSLPADIFLTSHARQFGRWKKLQMRSTVKNPADPFIDRAGYLEFVNRWQAIFNEWVVEENRS